MVADLFGEMHLRGDVLERVRTLPGMSPSRRQEAIAAAQTYPENPDELNELAWELVKLPGGEMSGYRKALRYSEEACQIEPKNGNLLTTLGMAYYRAGNYDKALDTLLRSDAIIKTERRRAHFENLAFLAMTHHQLGHANEAQAKLERLRGESERIKLDTAHSGRDAQAQALLREAEELLAKPKPPGSK
jgi:tetratricopeptide (TPR) repeat protein